MSTLVWSSLRSLVRAPAFTLTAISILALGLGASIALGTAIYRVLLAPLPYPDSDRLLALYTLRADGQPRPSSLLDVLDWRAEVSGLDGLAAYRHRSFGLDTEVGIEVVNVGLVTSDFFAVLGAMPAAGRTWTEAEEVAEARVVVLGERLWRQVLGAPPGIVGKAIRLNEEPYEVLGVLAPGLTFQVAGQDLDLYMPISHRDYGEARNIRSLYAVGRLAEGRTGALVGAELTAVAARLATAHAATNQDLSVGIMSLRRMLTGSNREPLWLLGGGALLLLIIACTNVANLQVARTVSRLGDLATRASLGASLRHVGGQAVAEAALLVLAGAGLGLLLAGAGLAALPSILPALGGRAGAGIDDLVLGAPSLAFAAGVALAAVPIFGALPVLLARRVDLVGLLKQGGQPLDVRERIRSSLVVLQVAMSVVLLSTALLLVRSYGALLATDPGFRSAGVWTFGLGLPARYDTEESIIGFYQRTSRALEALPGAASAAAAARLPLGDRGLRAGFSLIDADGIEGGAAINVVSPGYFRTLGMPLVAGRDFTWRDDLESDRVVMVNEAFRRAFLGDGDPLGRRIALSWRAASHPPGSHWRLIAVVGDTREVDLAEAPKPRVFLSLGQFAAEGATWLVRAPRLDAGSVQAAVDEIDPDLQRIDLGTLEATVEASVEGRRTALGVVLTIASLALVLTAVGLFAVISFFVVARRREWAVRATLGADRAGLVRLVVGRGLKLAGLGCVLGLAAAIAGSRLVEAHLYGVSARDGVTLAATSLMLLLVAAVAAWLPARRAAEVAPMDVMRS